MGKTRRKHDVQSGSKICSKCDINKEIGQYRLRDKKRGWYQSWCRSCENKKAVERRRSKEQKIKNREYFLNYYYGISLDDYNSILKDQNNSCRICGLPDSEYFRGGKKMNLSVDHCHDSGVVRGILCSDCNTSLGRFKEDPYIISRAVSYLDGNLSDFRSSNSDFEVRLHTSKKSELKKQFGISVDEFIFMVREQGNLCAICRLPESKLGANLSVDHCHATGKIRGLLCWKCNTALGLMRDNVETLSNMIDYLSPARRY